MLNDTVELMTNEVRILLVTDGPVSGLRGFYKVLYEGKVILRQKTTDIYCLYEITSQSSGNRFFNGLHAGSRL